MSLPKNNPSYIKKFFSYSIGEANLNIDDNIDKLIATMKKAFQEVGEIKAFSKWKEFNKVRGQERKLEHLFIISTQLTIQYLRNKEQFL